MKKQFEILFTGVYDRNEIEFGITSVTIMEDEITTVMETAMKLQDFFVSKNWDKVYYKIHQIQ